MRISYIDRISSFPIKVDGVGLIYCPTWNDVCRITFDKYETYIKLFMADKDTIVNTFVDKEAYDSIDLETRKFITVFDLIVSIEELRKTFCESFSFFCKTKSVFNKNEYAFILGEDNEVGRITREVFDDVKDVVLQITWTKENNQNSLKFKNNAARRIYEKINQAKSQLPKKSDIHFPDMVSAICARHNSLNYTNIGNLTISQIYDTFLRMNVNMQIDVSSLRWAAWGKESFDFSQWYKNII